VRHNENRGWRPGYFLVLQTPGWTISADSGSVKNQRLLDVFSKVCSVVCFQTKIGIGIRN